MTAQFGATRLDAPSPGVRDVGPHNRISLRWLEEQTKAMARPADRDLVDRIHPDDHHADNGKVDAC